MKAEIKKTYAEDGTETLQVEIPEVLERLLVPPQLPPIFDIAQPPGPTLGEAPDVSKVVDKVMKVLANLSLPDASLVLDIVYLHLNRLGVGRGGPVLYGPPRG